MYVILLQAQVCDWVFESLLIKEDLLGCWIKTGYFIHYFTHATFHTHDRVANNLEKPLAANADFVGSIAEKLWGLTINN